MIAIDTNVLVRLLVDDQPIQGKASQKLFASEDIFIPDTVLLETEWVLRAAFGLGRAEICAALRRVCGLRNVAVSDGPLVAQVIDWHEAGFDFADQHQAAAAIAGAATRLRRRQTGFMTQEIQQRRGRIHQGCT